MNIGNFILSFLYFLSIHSNTKGIVSDKGALLVHLFLFNSISSFFILFSIPPAFLGGTCLSAHSNCNDSIEPTPKPQEDRPRNKSKRSKY